MLAAVAAEVADRTAALVLAASMTRMLLASFEQSGHELLQACEEEVRDSDSHRRTARFLGL
jgi:hypothetical protein